MASRLLPVFLLLACWLPSESAGQQVRACPAAGGIADTTEVRPDLVIRASAHANEVVFRSNPEIDVRLTGCSALDSVRVLERRNLPRPVQPNTTYRDVFVAVEILGHLDVRCLLPALVIPADTSAGAPQVRGGALLGRLCPPSATDSIPRPPQPR